MHALLERGDVLKEHGADHVIAVKDAGSKDSVKALTNGRDDPPRSPIAEQLCRYLLRPPLALDRLRALDDGRIGIELKRECDGRELLPRQPHLRILRAVGPSEA